MVYFLLIPTTHDIQWNAKYMVMISIIQCHVLFIESFMTDVCNLWIEHFDRGAKN